MCWPNGVRWPNVVWWPNGVCLFNGVWWPNGVLWPNEVCWPNEDAVTILRWRGKMVDRGGQIERDVSSKWSSWGGKNGHGGANWQIVVVNSW